MPQSKDFGDFIDREISTDPKLAKAVEDEAFYYNIAEQIYLARHEAKLTQAELANRVDTKQSVIAQLEDADYHGHSITMLRRIADAVGKRLYLEFRNRFIDDYPGASSTVEQSTERIAWGASWDEMFNNVPCWAPRITETPIASRVSHTSMGI